MKSLKAYHLAHPYLDYHLQANKILMSPCILSPQNLNQHSKTGSSVQNIFDNNEEVRLRKLEISKQKQYDLLGAKQIKQYNIYKNKKKQDRRSNKDVTVSNNPSSRQSKQLYSNRKYLTKQEVLNLYPSHSPIVHRKTMTEECFSCSNRINITKMPAFMEPRFSHQNATDHSRIHSPKFSLNKLKQKLLQYQENWNRQIAKKTHLVAKSQKLKRNKQIIHKSVLQNRENSEVKPAKAIQKSLLLQNAILSLPWDQNLRNSIGKRLNSQKGSKSMKKLTVCGSNKYKKELKWIQQKDNDGFFFKKCQNDRK